MLAMPEAQAWTALDACLPHSTHRYAQALLVWPKFKPFNLQLGAAEGVGLELWPELKPKSSLLTKALHPDCLPLISAPTP